MGAAGHLAAHRGPIARGQVSLIYAGWGAADTLALVNRRFVADLTSRGAKVTTDEVADAGHVWPLWRWMAGEFLPRLFQGRPKAVAESPSN